MFSPPNHSAEYCSWIGRGAGSYVNLDHIQDCGCDLFAGRITFSMLGNAALEFCGTSGSWFRSTALSIAALATGETHIGLHRIRPAAPTHKLGNLRPQCLQCDLSNRFSDPFVVLIVS